MNAKTELPGIGMDDAESARVMDINGFYEIKDNPLSKAGIFDYLGSKIPGAPDPDKFYKVFRSPEELSDPECIDSFKLVPWINDHVMLGEEGDGYTPPEKKGVGGVTGENIYYDAKTDILRGNIKCFSSAHKTLIDSGKDELSLGYRCVYSWESGEWNGQSYDVAQRKIRGNHLASVDEGRCGPEIAVMDSSDRMVITFDSKEFLPMADEDKGTAAADADDENAGAGTIDVKAVLAAMDTLLPLMDKLKAMAAAPASDPVDPVEPGDPAPAATGDEDDDKKDDKSKPTPPAATATGDEDDKAGEAMDSIEQKLAARNKRKAALAAQIAEHVGVFDHSAMTEREVVNYGVSKLGVAVPKGASASDVLAGALQARKSVRNEATTRSHAMDAADRPSTGGFFGKQIAARK